MELTITILSAVMVAMAIFLVVAVLMQSGKDNRLSGTIAGGAETFFGKTKGKTIDRVLSKLTTVVSILFVILVFVVYVLQGRVSNSQLTVSGENENTDVVETETEEADDDPVAETVTEEAPAATQETETPDEAGENDAAENSAAENE